MLKLILQYARFGIVGIAATATHVGLFALSIETYGITPLLANLIAFGIAFVVSFFGHYWWTFAADRSMNRHIFDSMTRFAVVAGVGLALNSIVVYVVTEVFSAHYVYAIALMVTAVPIVLFILNKKWAFATPQESSDTPA